MRDISIIVPCWINDEETLQLTMNAIDSFALAEPLAEIVIIDNDSSVGGGYLRSKAWLYIKTSNNMGYTHAIWYGMQAASGQYLGLFNNDIRIASNLFSVAKEILQDDSIATVHPRMVNYDVSIEYGNQVAKTGKERWCQNSCVVTTRSFLKSMEEMEKLTEPYPGRLDLNFVVGGGYEDWDYFSRVRQLGFKTCYTDKTCFQHIHSHSLNKLGGLRQQIVEQNREQFIKKHGAEAEVLFEKEFPDQMAIPYEEGWKI